MVIEMVNNDLKNLVNKINSLNKKDRTFILSEIFQNRLREEDISYYLNNI